MRTASGSAAALMLLVVTACGNGNDRVAKQALTSFDVAEAPPPPEERMQPPGIVAPSPIAATAPAEPGIIQSGPQIAYSYGYTYELPAAAVAAAQARHVALCEQLGTGRCRVVRLERSGGGNGEYASGTLQLVVEAGIARDFGKRLDEGAAAAGGAPAGRTISAEDLSKQIVDTGARIRAKQALADRLIGLIRNKGAKVGELVEAERAFAANQEELDAAQSWMAEMRQRVAMSQVAINYQTTAPEGGGAWSPVRRSVAEAGRTFGSSLGMMLTFLILAVPWVALLALLWWLKRRLGWRWRMPLPWWRRSRPD